MRVDRYLFRKWYDPERFSHRGGIIIYDFVMFKNKMLIRPIDFLRELL